MIAAVASLARRHLLWSAPNVRLRATAAFELLIGASWVTLVVWALADAVSSAGGQASLATGSMPGMGMSPHTSVTEATIAGLPMWALMTAAMMLPGALPALSYVATHSYRWRRQRAMAQFAAVYLGLWIAFGALAMGLHSIVHARAGIEIAAALGIAAGWELTRFKRRALRDCHQSIPLPVQGPTAAFAPARFGLVNGCACVRACWPMMLAMTVVPLADMLLWMPILTALVTCEKLARQPRRATRIVAGALVLSAALASAIG